jgi:BMFP domain-containing protein YqiC
MRDLLKTLSPLVCLVSLESCDQRSTPSAANKASGKNVVVQDINEFESGVRLAAANKRIDELEQKVGALEATPEKLDLDLLSQRVTALEARGSGDVVSAPTTSPAADVPQSGRSAPRTGVEVRPSTARSSNLNLPELEPRLRLATPTEAKAFSPAK